MIRDVATETGVDPDLFQAICTHESSLNALAIRYEPFWKYFYYCRENAESLGISVNTETTLQAFSYGLCQIMGSVAREIGFRGPLTQLITDPALCLKHGAIHLKSFLQRYGSEPDAISAYNQGSNKKTDGGMFANQSYVDSVNQELIKLRKPKE
jgi:soluble lytic murein transglycosylase-like protein